MCGMWQVRSCRHEKMKCYPESDDCKSEYNLAEEDFHREARCDFFHEK